MFHHLKRRRLKAGASQSGGQDVTRGNKINLRGCKTINRKPGSILSVGTLSGTFVQSNTIKHTMEKLCHKLYLYDAYNVQANVNVT